MQESQSKRRNVFYQSPLSANPKEAQINIKRSLVKANA